MKNPKHSAGANLGELIEHIAKRLSRIRDFGLSGDQWLAEAELSKLQDDISALQELIAKLR